MKIKLFILVALVILAGLAFFGFTQGYFDSFLPSHQRLSKALEKVRKLNTLHAKYEMRGTTKVTANETGISQSVDYVVQGYMTGSTDGKVSQAEMAFSSPLNPSAAVNMELITAENGDMYVKGPLTEGKWMHMTKEEFKKYGEGPTDASLFPMMFVDSFFSSEHALTRSINTNSVQDMGDEEVRGMMVRVYNVEISMPEYIKFMSQDKDLVPEDIDDAEIILAKAVVNAKVMVDKKTGYVTTLVIDSENLTQIITEEVRKAYNLSSEHDAELTVNLSRFNTPTNIELPKDFVEYRDVVGTDTENKVLGVFTKR